VLRGLGPSRGGNRLLLSCPILAVGSQCIFRLNFLSISHSGHDGVWEWSGRRYKKRSGWKIRRNGKLTLSFLSPDGQSPSASRITSPPSGAAPDPMSVTLLRSYFFVRGDLASACVRVSARLSTSHFLHFRIREFAASHSVPPFPPLVNFRSRRQTKERRTDMQNHARVMKPGKETTHDNNRRNHNQIRDLEFLNRLKHL